MRPGHCGIGGETHSRGIVISAAPQQLREGHPRFRSHWGCFQVPRVNGARNAIRCPGGSLKQASQSSEINRLVALALVVMKSASPAWLGCTCEETLTPTEQPERVHCKRGTKSVRIVFVTRAKCQDFVVRFKDDGLPYMVNGPPGNATSKILVRQSRSPELREISRRFAPLWKVLAAKLRESFPERDTEDTHTYVKFQPLISVPTYPTCLIAGLSSFLLSRWWEEVR